MTWESGVKTFICLLLLDMGWIQHQLSKEKNGQNWRFFFKCRFSIKKRIISSGFGKFSILTISNLSPFNRIYGKQPSPWEKKAQRCLVNRGETTFWDRLFPWSQSADMDVLFFSESDVCRICMSYCVNMKSGNPPWARNKTYYIHDTVTKFLRSFGLGNHHRFSAYRRPRPLNTVHLALKFSSW